MQNLTKENDKQKSRVKLKIKDTLKAAFPHTIPILTGYVFLGIAFGILLQEAGYNFLWAGFMSLTVFSGSMQFVAVTLLGQAFSILSTLFITIMVNARYLFYGFSMLEKFKNMGKFKAYLIFSLTDEIFILLYSLDPPAGINRKGFYFCIASLCHLYWITGGIIGTLVGTQLSFDTTGIDFVMLALFVAIFTDQMREKRNRLPGLIGLLASSLCLLIFGPENFILAAMAGVIAILTFVRKPLERSIDKQ
ncbi:branched-chain amino acid ABC transporter permease [bacterium]|nr:branched-chain amino acid ABC transporter permease [bacterium]